MHEDKINSVVKKALKKLDDIIEDTGKVTLEDSFPVFVELRNYCMIARKIAKNILTNRVPKG